MDQQMLEKSLADLPIKAARFFNSVGSTNDEAAVWIEEGAPDLALVVADQQTAGRGRMGRNWYTPPGAALAFSLVLFPVQEGDFVLPRFTALGALAVCDALSSDYGLPAKIKWPNDVMLAGRKVAGVLAEAYWLGESMDALVLGIGINVAPPSVLDESQLRFPATCIDDILGRQVDRLELLHSVLVKLIGWRPLVGSSTFLQTWEERLAYHGDWVRVIPDQSPDREGYTDEPEKISELAHEGQILGLAPDGSLKLRTRSGEVVMVNVGEVRLLPVDK